MSNDSEIAVRVARDQDLAEEWALVLLAQGLSPSVRQSAEGIVLSVPQGEVNKARAALLAYESENSPSLADRAAPAWSASSLAAGAVIGALVILFFIVTVASNSTMSWFEQGSADSHRIIGGELWRTVTALTLHADVAHAVSNAIALALFFAAVSSALGVGLGGALILLAGAGGNLTNAFLQAPFHISVGASTSIFGAVGMLGAIGLVMRRRTVNRRRVWLPIAAALALLGILGTGAGRVDVWAHLFGFLVGAVLGVIAANVTQGPPGIVIQWTFGGAAVAMLLYCWMLAVG
jgi:membrane associated rhomboid family serine protease